MNKIITLILFMLSFSFGVIARDLPPPTRGGDDCHPLYGCTGIPIDDYIFMMMLVSLLLGVWLIQHRQGKFKTM